MPEILDALGRLVAALVAAFGPTGTVLLLLAVAVAATAWRLYQDKRKDREFNLLIEEKDKTIQRLASQERFYRAMFFKDKVGMPIEELERLIMRNDFSNTAEAREALESPPAPQIQIPESDIDQSDTQPSSSTRRRER